MTRPVRVLHVFQKLARGGAELRTIELLRRVGPEKVIADVAVLSGEPGALDGEWTSLGGKVVPLPLGPAFPWRFVRQLRRAHYDAVHSHVHHSSGLILLLARAAGVPSRIAHFRNTDDRAGHSAVRRLRRFVLKSLIDLNATSILAVGKGAMRAAWREEWDKDPRCQVIYNGLDTAPFTPDMAERSARLRRELGLHTGARVVLHVGRMSPQKNHGRVLSIFERLAARDPSWTLVLAGRTNPTIESELSDRLDRADLRDRVRILGERDDVPGLFAAADVLLFPSLWEGLPGAVLEAVASGVAVVASDLPGVREIAEHFEGISVFDLRHDDEQWADEIVQAAAKTGHELREKNLAAFVRSPFALSTAADSVLDVWRHGTE